MCHSQLVTDPCRMSLGLSCTAHALGFPLDLSPLHTGPDPVCLCLSTSSTRTSHTFALRSLLPPDNTPSVPPWSRQEGPWPCFLFLWKWQPGGGNESVCAQQPHKGSLTRNGLNNCGRGDRGVSKNQERPFCRRGVNWYAGLSPTCRYPS